MSQSETWDLIRIAADWRDGAMPGMPSRGPAEIPAMPEPEVKWVRRTSRTFAPRFVADEPGDYIDEDTTIPSRGEQILDHRSYWDRFEWLRWRTPGSLDTSAFDAIMRDAFSTAEVAWMAMARNSLLFGGIDRWTVGTPYSPRFLPRAGVTAALIALPGYRDA